MTTRLLTFQKEWGEGSVCTITQGRGDGNSLNYAFCILKLDEVTVVFIEFPAFPQVTRIQETVHLSRPLGCTACTLIYNFIKELTSLPTSTVPSVTIHERIGHGSMSVFVGGSFRTCFIFFTSH